MATNTLNSLMPLWLYAILKEKSSVKNPLSRKDLEKILTEKYNITIGEKDRNKVRRCINALREYFKEIKCDGAIKETQKKTKNDNNANVTVPAWYLDVTVAPPIFGGDFSLAEVNLLTDMVNDSQIISSKCTSALIHKLAASLSEEDSKEIRGKELERGAYKNENKDLYKIKDKVEEAIESNRQVTITYEIDGVEDDFAITPIKIDYKDGECFILGYRSEKLEAFSFDNIRFIDLWKENVDHIDAGQTLIDAENSKINEAIALDTLFANTRVIRDAINNKQYLCFSYCSYTMQDNKVKLTESDPQSVIPIKTAYKNGKPYLIAIDPENHQPVFFRIDLMKNVGTAGRVDFMEYRKFDIKDNAEYTDKHPFMLSGFTKIRATFLIKADSLDRVVDAFGNKATFLEKKKALEILDPELNTTKLAIAFPELDLVSDYGFNNDDEIVLFNVETTDEEAIRFALQNGDVAELVNPELRSRILQVTKMMHAKHTRNSCDYYQNVISGDEFLILSSLEGLHKKIRSLIEKNNTFNKVTKLEIQNTETPIPVSELEKYTNVKELVISGNGVADFSWIKKLSSLRKLTLVNTLIEGGEMLAEIPQLEMLFLNRNRLLKNYEFIKNMKVGRLFIGRNGKADLSALYDLKSVNELAVEENLLFDLDIGKLENIRTEIDGRPCRMSVQRWIDDEYDYSDPPRIYRLNPQLFRNK